MFEIQNANNSDEWIDWVERAISTEYIQYYEFKYFRNFQKIGSGEFGKVYSTNWKESHFALKSFFDLDKITTKEIIREVIIIL